MKPSEFVDRFETQISEMRNSGKSWGDIADKLCFETGETVSSLSLKVAFNRRSSQSPVDETPKRPASKHPEKLPETDKKLDKEIVSAINAAAKKINDLKSEIDILQKQNDELNKEIYDLRNQKDKLEKLNLTAITEAVKVADEKTKLKIELIKAKNKIKIYEEKYGELQIENNNI